MAREMALAGVPKEELERVETPQEPQTPKSKWQNFWFYYKWWVVAAVCLLAIIGVGVWQAATRVEPDYPIALVTRDGVSEEGVMELETLLATYGQDLNGDGKVVVEVEDLALSQYVGGRKNPQAEMNSQKIMAYLVSADVMFFIFDKPSYENYLGDLKENSGVDLFFDDLGRDVAGVDKTENYWNWNGDDRKNDYWGAEFPEDLYFGVRRLGGTADSEAAISRHDNDLALLQAVLDDEVIRLLDETKQTKQ